MDSRFLTKIGEQVIVFKPPPERAFHWRRSGNIILVKGSRGISLFDSGGVSSKHQLLSLLEDEISSPNLPIHCLHTHGHIDHIGGDHLLIEKFNAQIWASQEAIPFIIQQSPLFLKLEKPHMIVNFKELFTAPAWFVKGIIRLTMGRNRPVSNVKVLEPKSDPTETNFFPIDTPGHHAGHVGFYNPDSEVFISGDILDPRYGMKPLLSSPSSNFDLLKDTIGTMLEYSIKVLIPGHGSPIIGYENVQQGLKSALDILDHSLENVTDSLYDNTLTLEELSLKMRGMGLGPGDVFRRMFIHSVLKKFLFENKISSKLGKKNRTMFSSCS